MDRDGQLDHAEPGAEVAAGHADRGDRLLPQLVGKLTQVGGGERTEIGGDVHRVEQRRLERVNHRRGLAPCRGRVDYLL